MGDETESEQRIKAFENYQVNENTLDQANSDVMFLHCLPAIKGQEISTTLLDDQKVEYGGKLKIDYMHKKDFL